MDLKTVRIALQGKKTFLVAIAIILLVMFSGQPYETVAETLVNNATDPDKMQSALWASLAMTGKAAWDRFAGPLEAEDKEADDA